MQRRRWQLFVVFAVVCVLMGGVTRGYLMDDALIALRYARHLADSGRATWNPPGSEAPLIGYTSIAWMMLQSMIALVVKDPDALIVCAKLTAGAALVANAWLFADRLARGPASMGACVLFGFLLFGNAGHGLHANSAMETMLFSTVTLLVIWSRDREQVPLASYAWAALAVLVRPEGLVVTPVLAWFDLRAGRKKVALLGSGLVVLTVIVTLVTLARHYDSLMPSAFLLKVGGPYPKRYGLLAVLFFATLCVPAFAVSCFHSGQRGHATSKLAFAMSAALMMFLVYVRPIMNDCFRYEWPALFWLAFGALPLLENQAVVGPRLRLAIVALIMVLNLRTSHIALNYARDDVSYSIDRDIGRALARSVPGDQWLSVLDAGIVPYFADLPTHDVFGLADGAAVRGGVPYLTHARALIAFCRPDVAVVVVGISDQDAELFRVLHACGFRRRVELPVVRCGEHWIAKGVFFRDGVPIDTAALVTRRDNPEQCPWDTGAFVDVGSWRTWLTWDGATR